MMPDMETFSDQLRRAIDSCGLTRYRIAKLTGLTQSMLCRFLAGHAITSGHLDKLAELLRLRITMQGPPKRLVAKVRRRGDATARPAKVTPRQARARAAKRSKRSRPGG
jgi:transcriptional regulator with XRE-family HTH domain